MAGSEQKSFDTPDEVREFPHGRAEILKIGGGEVGRLFVEPGWRWSEHVMPIAGTELCELPHVALVLSGTLAVQMADGSEEQFSAGDVMLLPPGHDAWTVGEQACTFVEFSRGNDYYAS